MNRVGQRRGFSLHRSDILRETYKAPDATHRTSFAPQHRIDMPLNTHLSPQLTSFANLSNPGYAILIDAPWGAGKSHEVKEWRKAWSADPAQTPLYISLYGVADVTAIEEAMIEAVMSLRGTKLGISISKFVDGVMKKHTGASVDVSGLWRKAILKQVPQTLIFDDLERTKMPITQLLGALNRYVEHEQKNVILIANQRELENSAGDEYRTTREKVIGRIITIQADAEAALDAFLNAVTPGAAKDFLQKERSILSSVFQKSDNQNLRLLRQALLEFSRFYDNFPDDVRRHEQGMRHLAATFIALSVAFHGGMLTNEELGTLGPTDPENFRGLFKDSHTPSGTEPMTPAEQAIKVRQDKVKSFQEKWARDPNVLLGNAMILTPELCKKLIVEGHADEAMIQNELSSVYPFANAPGQEAAWQTLWHWLVRDSNAVIAALKTIEQQLANNEFLEPKDILHVAGVLLNLAKVGVRKKDVETARDEMLAYIARIEAAGLLKSNIPKAEWSNHLRLNSSYGLGILQSDTNEFGSIDVALQAALDRSFWQNSKLRNAALLEMIRKAPNDFNRAISNHGRPNDIPNYAHVPVLTTVEPVEFADALLSLPLEGLLIALAPFEERITRHEASEHLQKGGRESERKWLELVRAEMERRAENSNWVRAAQIRYVLKMELTFLSPHGEDV